MNAPTENPTDHLNRLFKEWQDCQHGVDRDEAAIDSCTDRGAELERLIAAEPAHSPYQIRHKLAIMRDYAVNGPPRDALHVLMIGSIEADLVTFEMNYVPIECEGAAKGGAS